MKVEDNDGKLKILCHLPAYAGADGNLYAVWEMACGIKGLKM